MATTIPVGLILALGIGLWLASQFTRWAGKVVGELENAAAGDLTCRISVKTSDELGRIGADVNLILEIGGKVVVGIGKNSQSLATSSEELSAVSHQMSANAEETSGQANVVTAAAGQATHNLQTWRRQRGR